MNLANDKDRCNGVGSDQEGWREGCDKCLRRIAPRTGNARFWLMIPPPLKDFRCEYLIEDKK